MTSLIILSKEASLNELRAYSFRTEATSHRRIIRHKSRFRRAWLFPRHERQFVHARRTLRRRPILHRGYRERKRQIEIDAGRFPVRRSERQTVRGDELEAF